MTIIKVKTAGQMLAFESAAVTASGSVNTVKLQVTLDAPWAGLAVSAVFFTKKVEIVYEKVLTEGECIVPHEVLTDSDILFIGLRGVNSGDGSVLPSTLVQYRILTGAPAGDGTTEDPTPDVYQQLLTAYGNVENKIALLSAQTGQVSPLFANSIEECTDTGKLYVLPDGYIYAYMTRVKRPYTNQIENAIDTDGTLYNGKGWKSGSRLDSSGQVTELGGWEVTGFIPITKVSKVYFNNIIFNGDGQGKDYLSLYDSNFSCIASQQIVSSWLPSNTFVDQGYATLDSDGNLKYLDFSCLVSGGFAGIDKTLLANMAYLRLSAYEITDDSAIAVDEEITAGEILPAEWTNTGHAFVPADYEDRIIALEETSETNAAELASQKRQIEALVSGEDTAIPDYVITEADAVIDKVIAAQGNRTFTFAAIADMHYGAWSYADGILHACQALQHIGERIELDAVAVLGDYTDGYPDTHYDNAIADFKAVNKALDGLRFAPNLRFSGNHDIYSENPALSMRYINAYSDDVVWGSREGGYFYRDFAGYKLRVIGVNTNETAGATVSDEQYNWFVSALDLCGKEDAKEWSILILSHHPLDWHLTNDAYPFAYILDAYKNGTSGTAGGITYDFTGGKNAAKLVGNIHGHIHNFKVDNMYLGNANAGKQSDVLRIATPNACYNRENEYEGVWAEDAAYGKTLNSAEDTSFCVYCIDLDAGTIKAICYGAGYDREISYQYINDVVPQKRTEAIYTHAIPTSLSMVNAIKRARQLTDVVWTAKGTFDGKKKVNGVYEDHDFVEGQTYKGVPYAGGVASRYTYVGLNVDLDTFFSAVQNPKSILYTFNANGANNHAKGGAYYGTVCSKFAQGVLNIPASMNTNNVDNIEGLDTIAERGKYNEYDVKLCDIMVDPSYHTVIVTDILYDSFGRVAFVEISEAVTPLCRRLLWTPEEFNTQWVPTYKLCRYQHINDIPYDKKDYLNIESENAEIPASVTDPTLMPQYGDKKNNKLKSGGTMPVHILKSGYTKAVVLRDGVVISETDITNATEFTYPLGTTGYIEMYLEDADGNQSEHRYACVTQATIEVTDSSEYNDGKLSVKYTGSAGKPHYVQFNGMSEFCRLDGLGRSTIVDENNAVLSFEVKRAAKSVRVAYQNEYGTYYSDYAEVVINVDTDGDAYISKGTLHEGYTLTEDSSAPVVNEQSTNCWVYTDIPVEANTTYLVEGATRIWFFAYNGSEVTPISSIAADEQETPYQFTTPDKTWKMSVCYTEDTANKGAETVVRIGATDAVIDMLVSETGAELVDGYKLNGGTYKTEADENQFVFKNIPVEQGATYYTRGANRIWLLDAEKASTGRTGNVLNTWKEAGVFVVSEKADSPEVKYVSITYSRNAGAAPDMVYIRKLT